MKINWNYKRKGFRCSLCLLLTIAMIIALAPMSSEIVYADESSVKEQYDSVMNTAVPDTFLNPDYEPYGFGVDVPFLMNQQSEILFYQMNGDKASAGGDITTFYDKLKAGNTEDIYKGATATSAMKNPPVDLRKASFVQAISFDPRGTGRKDHIAFIGVNANKYAYVWVYDTRNQKWYRTSGDNGGFSIVYCSWLQSEDITDFEAANFLSITAGDYDGDGRDTIVVYAIGNYVNDNTSRYQLYELKVSSPAVGSSGSIGISKTKTTDSFIWSYKYADKTDKQYRIGCDLATGDVDGDSLDDLVAVSYYGDVENSNQKAAWYRPYLCIYHGKEGNTNIFSKVGGKVGLWEGYANESDDKIKNKNWKSIVSPGIACGDIDNDGIDEIVASGVKNVIHANSAANAADTDDIDKYNLGVYIIDNGDVIQKEIAANKWTTNGFYVDDKVWNKTAVECVAVNGMGNPEMVFISGTLYDFDSESRSLTEVHTPGYFQNAGDNLGFKASTNMYIQSTTAGNFDGNDKGFEQVAFTVSCKTQSYQNYDYLMGVLGGKNHNKMSGIATGYYSTSAGSMDDDNSYPHRVNQSNRAGNISENNGLNCLAIAVDNDNDGMLMRYKEKTLTNADPDVLCVLQMAPYFKELEQYMDGKGSTKYTITNTFSFERSETSSSSFGVAGVVKLGTPACEIEVQAGYAREWSQEFTNGHETTEEYWWEADKKDKVVVFRTPVVSYKYQVQDQNGVWESNGNDNSWIISVPSDPVYTTMTINQYNEFVKYYNNEMAKKTNDFRRLQPLNNTWLGHEGEPDKYLSATSTLFNTPGNGYELIQKRFQPLGHDSGSSGYSLEEGTSSSVTESLEHGFTFDASVGVGPDLGPVSFSVGVSTSLENMSGESTTTSTATSKGIECSVANIDDDEIPAELKPSKFTMRYKAATWPSGLKKSIKGKETENVPVFGYALSGVYNPIKSGDLSEEEIEALSVIDLMESISDSSAITLADEDNIIYIREEFEKLSTEARKYVNETILITAEEKIRILKEFDNGDPKDISEWIISLSDTGFTYNGEIQKPKVLSIWGLPLKEDEDYVISWSDESSKNAGEYQIYAEGKGDYTGTASATYIIEPKSIKEASIKIAAGDYMYNGSEHKPNVVSVIADGIELSKDDYKVSYKNNIQPGTASVTVTGIGNFSDSATTSFVIKEKLPEESQQNTEPTVKVDSETKTDVGSGPETSAKPDTVDKLAVGTSHKVNGNTVKVISASAKAVAFTKAANKKSVTVPAAVKIKGKTFKVTQINANAFTGKKIRTVTIGKNVKSIKKNAFKGSKATKIILKTKLLKKAKVKGSLKGSKIKTIQVKIGKKSVNKTYVKKYKKIFTKANAGKKVAVK